jgi:multidrug efflux pump subunit AcrA (membrane-fusion protein)
MLLPRPHSIGEIIMKIVFEKLTVILIKFALPLGSIVLLGLAVNSVIANRSDLTLKSPPALPSRSPFSERVSGMGLIEPQSESIEIGSPVAGLVDRVVVVVGQRVAAHEPLFHLDDRDLQAELAVRKAELATTQAQLERLTKLPRVEEVPVNRARVEEAQASLNSAEDEYRRNMRIGPGVVPEEQRVKSKNEVERTRAHLRSSEAELKLLEAGAWGMDLEVSKQTAAKAQALVQQLETQLDRLTIRAPIAGTVLQVQVHAGESISSPANRSLLVLGNIDRLHVRVNIDEHEILRFKAGAPAQAQVIGHPELSYPLAFLHVEPYVTPKRSLSGDNRERVDTRVLQAVYELTPPKSVELFVGQQVNVYIEAGHALQLAALSKTTSR